MGPCSCSTLASIMWVKVNYRWIWTVIMDLKRHKVDPRGRNTILVQISSTKKDHVRKFLDIQNFTNILIFRTEPYWEIFIFNKPSSLTFSITNFEIQGIIWFATFPGFVNAKNLLYAIFKYCKFCTINITSHNLLFGW